MTTDPARHGPLPYRFRADWECSASGHLRLTIMLLLGRQKSLANVTGVRRDVELYGPSGCAPTGPGEQAEGWKCGGRDVPRPRRPYMSANRPCAILRVAAL